MVKANRERPAGERRMNSHGEYIFELRTEQNPVSVRLDDMEISRLRRRGKP